MIVAYVGAGCWSCERAQVLLLRSRTPHRIVRVKRGSDVAERLVADYPSLSCPVCDAGVSLPAFVLEDGSMIGDTYDLEQYLKSHAQS